MTVNWESTRGKTMQILCNSVFPLILLNLNCKSSFLNGRKRI